MTAKKLAIIGNQAAAMLNFRGPLIRALVAEGVEVFAFAPDYTDRDRSAVTAMGAAPIDFHLTRAGISPIGDIASTLQLIGLLRSIKPHIVLSVAVKPVIYGTVAAWIAGVKHRFALVEGLGHVFIAADGLKSRMLKWVVSALYRFALSKAETTLFLNDDDKADFISAHLWPPPKPRPSAR